MTAYQKEILFKTLVNNKVYGYPNHITSHYLETDKRKTAKTMRELVAAGYLSQTGDKYTITNKLWDETPTESVNLFDIWEKDRKDGWNQRKNFTFVRFNRLTDGQKVTMLATAGHYEWSICYVGPLDYQQHSGYGDLSVGIDNPDVELGMKVRGLREDHAEVLKKQKRGGFNPEFEVIIAKRTLTDYIEKTLAQEHFDALYKSNLKWALSALGVVPEDDAKEIVSSDEPGWVLGGGNDGNLGADPLKWGTTLQEKITAAKESIERVTRRLAIMEQIDSNVTDMGGWDVFREQMAAKLREELAKKS